MANPSDVRWFEFGKFRLDARALVLFRGSRIVPLPVRAVETLVGLVRRPGEVLLKGDLPGGERSFTEHLGLAKGAVIVKASHRDSFRTGIPIYGEGPDHRKRG